MLWSANREAFVDFEYSYHDRVCASCLKVNLVFDQAYAYATQQYDKKLRAVAREKNALKRKQLESKSFLLKVVRGELSFLSEDVHGSVSLCSHVIFADELQP